MNHSAAKPVAAHTPAPMSVNDLMMLGDSAACNILDMIDANECGARTASDEQLGIWYAASAEEFKAAK